MTHARRSAQVAVTAALTALVALAACGEQRPAPAAPAGAAQRLLVVDGIEITLADVAPWVEFLDSFGPEVAQRVKVRRVLDEYLLPLRFAERSFAAVRATQMEYARQLCSVATNTYELEQRGALLVQKRRSISYGTIDFPIARFVFDELRLGSVSEPLAVPRGFVVASGFDVHKTTLVSTDSADAVLVGFFTHSPADWSAWLDNEKHRVGDKVTFVHPDYREAMPQWLQLP
jgi:hypothetical protein